MKDLKVPEMSIEEREKEWAKLKENNILVRIDYNYWSDGYNVKQFRVVKRTPKGFIRLDNGELLKEFSPNYHIVTEELKEWCEKIKLEEEIYCYINLYIPRNKKAFKNNLSYEDAVKLQEIFNRTIPEKKI